MNSDDGSSISTLRPGQEKVLAILPLVSGTISILGSSLVIALIMKDRKKTSYKRLTLGLSLCDIMSSISFALQALFVPQGSSRRFWALGTPQTCSMLGFVSHFTLCTIWYHGMLSCHFLLKVRFRVSEDRMRTRYEPFMHTMVLGYNLSTAVFAVAFGWYDEVRLGPGCWITSNWCANMDSYECAFRTYIIEWIYGGLPMVIIFLLILTNNMIIYYFVRSTMLKARRFSLQGNEFHAKKIREVAIQGFAFVATFIICYVWIFAIRVYAGTQPDGPINEQKVYGLLVLQAFFSPLHGFFNLCIYSRPYYAKLRRAFPEEARIWILYETLFGMVDDMVGQLEVNLFGLDISRFNLSALFGTQNEADANGSVAQLESSRPSMTEMSSESALNLQQSKRALQCGNCACDKCTARRKVCMPGLEDLPEGNEIMEDASHCVHHVERKKKHKQNEDSTDSPESTIGTTIVDPSDSLEIECDEQS